MPDAFDLMIDTLFNNADLSSAGVYTPSGGSPVSVRVLKRIPPTQDISLGNSRASTSGITLTLRVSEVPDEPPRDSTLVVDGITYIVESAKSIARNKEWSLDARPS